ncbi:hypothetical protein [Enterococcus sp. AZ196]|uniref:hypothetical protein n=1 Tax=Enterococcus sp. AZ196 TaxID=2774659 RepID=UPI003D289AB2
MEARRFQTNFFCFVEIRAKKFKGVEVQAFGWLKYDLRSKPVFPELGKINSFIRKRSDYL